MLIDNHPTPNPFYHRVPIQDPAYFFGRAQELHRIFSLIAYGQSVSLIGPRRMGKSSLLVQLSQVRHGAHHGLVADRQTFVYFDGAAWQDQRPHVLYAALWSVIAQQFTSHPDGSPHVRNLPSPAATELDFSSFQRALRQLHTIGHDIILLIDEFDALSRNRHLDEVFFSSLRSLAATQGITFVTASTAPLLELTYARQSALSSPFFNIFLPQRLGLLSDAEAHDLLIGTAAHGSFSLSDQQATALLALAGPHPFFLQIAGYHWWEEQGTAQIDLPHHVQSAFEAEAEPHWIYQWRYLSTDEQRLLALLETTAPQSATILRHLQQLGMVRQQEERPTYLSAAFERFVRHQAIHQLIQIGPLIIDQQTNQCWLAGELLALAPQDYRLLVTLAQNADQSMRYPELARQLWPDEETAVNHQVRLKSAVNSLRRKLGDHADLVTTDSNGSYRLLMDDPL